MKLDPSFIDKYAVFAREQDHEQRAVADRNTGRGHADQLSDLDFQKNYRCALAPVMLMFTCHTDMGI